MEGNKAEKEHWAYRMESTEVAAILNRLIRKRLTQKGSSNQSVRDEGLSNKVNLRVNNSG